MDVIAVQKSEVTMFQNKVQDYKDGGSRRRVWWEEVLRIVVVSNGGFKSVEGDNIMW